jgi:hypothetical protein
MCNLFDVKSKDSIRKDTLPAYSEKIWHPRFRTGCTNSKWSIVVFMQARSREILMGHYFNILYYYCNLIFYILLLYDGASEENNLVLFLNVI